MVSGHGCSPSIPGGSELGGDQGGDTAFARPRAELVPLGAFERRREQVHVDTPQHVTAPRMMRDAMRSGQQKRVDWAGRKAWKFRYWLATRPQVGKRGQCRKDRRIHDTAVKI